jgi:two-component system, cell cycle sensor histidine kinase and response regulator CckA
VAPPLILVVDDEVVIRSLVTVILRASGYGVIEAADGQRALELSRDYDGTIHLLITDIEMPHLDGVALLTAMRAERPGIACMAMSGNDPAIVAAAHPDVPFLAKPFETHELLHGVRRLLTALPLA